MIDYNLVLILFLVLYNLECQQPELIFANSCLCSPVCYVFMLYIYLCWILFVAIVVAGRHGPVNTQNTTTHELKLDIKYSTNARLTGTKAAKPKSHNLTQ